MERDGGDAERAKEPHRPLLKEEKIKPLGLKVFVLGQVNAGVKKEKKKSKRGQEGYYIRERSQLRGREEGKKTYLKVSYVLACQEVPAIAVTKSCYKCSDGVFLSWKGPGAEPVLLLGRLLQRMLPCLSPWVSGIHCNPLGLRHAG